ncbi:MAG: transcriptional regulator TrmB [Candidatus Taylorbacteria bacterium]|nr:transcriptional regulator TrmB [Candidatus Taylorbacteria bacterium]
MDKIKEILRELGLNDIEMQVFLGLLDIGSGVASVIANNTGLNRITTYEALKRLSKKGLVKIRAKKGSSVKYFVPEEFETIKEKLELKKKTIETAISRAGEMKSYFDAKFRHKEGKPEVLFYEGKEGIEKVLMDTLKECPGEILSFSSAESLEEGFDSSFLKGYWNKRVALKIKTRGILPDTEKARKDFNKERNQKELRELLFLPSNLFSFKNEIDMYGDTMVIISLTKGSEHAVVIKSPSVVQGMRSVFETMWNIAKK